MAGIMVVAFVTPVEANASTGGFSHAGDGIRRPWWHSPR